MTDNEIIKALECHMSKSLDDCEKCPFYAQKRAFHNCHEHLYESLLDLLNRQKAEIEKRERGLQFLQETIGKNESRWLDIVAEQRVEAIKEFAERLKANEREHCQWCNHSNKGSRSEWCDELIDGHCRCLGFSKFESKLDNLVKEMVGEDAVDEATAAKAWEKGKCRC